MPKLCLLLDTNVVIDFLNRREPFCEDARMIMILGRLGELKLWLCASQITDIIYVLSDGGASTKIPDTLERMRGLRTFVDIHPVDGAEVDRMLATSWKDPEDALLYEAALDLKADFIVTRNAGDFEGKLVRTASCEEVLSYMRETYGLEYEEIEMPS